MPRRRRCSWSPPRQHASGLSGTGPKDRRGWRTAAHGHTRARARHHRTWYGGSCGCGGDTGSDRYRSPAGSALPPRPCTPYWSGAGSTGCPASTGSPANPLRRYEHDHPGSLLHVDVTKFGNIPDGGGHRFVGRQQGYQNQLATPGLPKGKDYKPRTGKAFLHTVIDDHSRVAYAEIHTDEKARTAAAVLQRAVAWFKDHGVTVERVLSDNGACYRSFAWRDSCTQLSITHKRTRPYRPQTNGKIERFHRTLADGWAYAQFYNSTNQRNAALPGWLHFYNHHRPHSAIGGQPPITRLTNLPEHHS
jgi:transposase InsO family protein